MQPFGAGVYPLGQVMLKFIYIKVRPYSTHAEREYRLPFTANITPSGISLAPSAQISSGQSPHITQSPIASFIFSATIGISSSKGISPLKTIGRRSTMQAFSSSITIGTNLTCLPVRLKYIFSIIKKPL